MNPKPTDKVCSSQISKNCVKIGEPALFPRGKSQCRECIKVKNRAAYLKNNGYDKMLESMTIKEKRLEDELQRVRKQKLEILEITYNYRNEKN